MPYVPVILPNKGELSKTGCVKNENCPVQSVNNASIAGGDWQGIYTYTITEPDFTYQVHDGWIISKAIPEKVTTAFETLAAFQLYKMVNGVETPFNKWLAFEYKVRHWYKHTAGTGQNEHSVIDYTIDVRARIWEEDTSDNLAPYIYTDIMNNGFATVSGTLTESAYSNIVGFDNRYIGFVFHIGTYNNTPFFGMIANMVQYLYLSDNRWVRNASSVGGIGVAIYNETIGDYHIKPIIKTDPNETDGGKPSGEGGGGGDRDDISDPVGFPDLPSLSATAAGFVTLYNPSLAQIQALAAEINSETLWDSFKNFFDRADEYVAGLGIIPVQPEVAGSVYPKFGWFTFDVAMPLITSQYKEVRCGSLDIHEFYGSAFDYSGMTSISLYLPYIGYRDIDVDGAMARTMEIRYYVDVYSGNCVAMIAINGIVQYHFSGNCLQQIPVSSLSYDDMIKNGVTLAAAVVGAVATGGASAAESAATGGAEMLAAGGEASATTGAISSASANAVIGSSMVNVMNSKPNVNRSGALGGSSGMLGVQYPYIIKKIPRQSLPSNYNAYAGYPCNMTVTLNNLNGFFVVDTINMSGVPATDEELAEILAYLKGGVIK